MRTQHVAAALVVVSLVCAAAYPVYDPSDYSGKGWVSSKGDRVTHEYKYIGVRPWARPGTPWGPPKTEEETKVETKKPKKRKPSGKVLEKALKEPEVEAEVPEEKTKKPPRRHKGEGKEVPMVEHGPKVEVIPAFEEEEQEVGPSLEPSPAMLPPEPSEPPAEGSLVAELEEEREEYTYETILDYPELEEVACAVAVESEVAWPSMEPLAPPCLLAPEEYGLEEEEYEELPVVPKISVLPEEVPAEPSVAAVEPAPTPSVSPVEPSPPPSVSPVVPSLLPAKSPHVKVPERPPHEKKHRRKASPLPYYSLPPTKPVESPPPPHAKKKKAKEVPKKPAAAVVEEPKEKPEEVGPPVKKKKAAKKAERCCCACGKKQPPGCYCYPTLPKRQFPTYYTPKYSPYIRPGPSYEEPPTKPSKPSAAKGKGKSKKLSLPPAHKKEIPEASPESVVHEPELPHGKRAELKKFEVPKKKTRHHPKTEVPERKEVKVPAPAVTKVPAYHFPQERYSASYPHHYYGPATRVKVHCGPDEYCGPGAKRRAKKKAFPYGYQTKPGPKHSPVVAYSTEEVPAVAKPEERAAKAEVPTTEKPKLSKKCRKCKRKCKRCKPCLEDEHGCAMENLSTDEVLAQF